MRKKHKYKIGEHVLVYEPRESKDWIHIFIDGETHLKYVEEHPDEFRPIRNIDITKHKRRFDRGGVYMGYYNMIGMSLILMNIFGLNKWYYYVIFTIAVCLIRYAAGYLDDKYVLKKEQRQYSENNPFLAELNDKLDKIIEKLM